MSILKILYFKEKIMKMRFTMSLFVSTLVLFSGCGSSSVRDGAKMSSGDDRDMGSLTIDDNLSLKKLLKGRTFRALDMDLDKFVNDEKGNVKLYEVDMTFHNNSVEALADCQIVKAKYRVSNDELSFSKISMRPATELPSCKESEDADEAVYNFFRNSYTLKNSSESSIKLYSEDVESEVTLIK